MSIKEKIIDNEKKLLQLFPQYRTSIRLFISRLKKIKLEGDIYKFIQTFSHSRIEQYRVFNNEGHKSALDILNESVDNVNIFDVTNESNLIVGDYYNYVEISAFANNFNFLKGMYYNSYDNNIIIKSQIQGEMYNDHWIIVEDELYYCLENEIIHSNYINKTFGKTPNRMIYERLINSNDADIHVFV